MLRFTPPHANLALAARADRERAMAEAGRIGPTPGILVDELLPPLPHTVDMLAAMATTCPGDQWVEVQLEMIDPRAPWRQVATGSVWVLPGVGSFWVCGAGPAKGWEAFLLTCEAHGPTEHRLIRSGSRRPVRMDSRYDAMQALEPVIYADGVVPRGWVWDPFLGPRNALWTPSPRGTSSPGLARISWSGRSGRWRVEVSPNQVTVAINGKRVANSTGDARIFDDARAAKVFCVRSDGRRVPRRSTDDR